MDAERMSDLSRLQPPVHSRRAVLGASGALVLGSRVRSGRAAPATPAATPVTGDAAERVLAITRQTMGTSGLKAAIVRVVVDGNELVTAALGESMTGVPATADMRFRNGAVAFSYMATLLLQFVDQKRISLDDPLATWSRNYLPPIRSRCGCWRT